MKIIERYAVDTVCIAVAWDPIPCPPPPFHVVLREGFFSSHFFLSYNVLSRQLNKIAPIVPIDIRMIVL